MKADMLEHAAPGFLSQVAIQEDAGAVLVQACFDPNAFDDHIAFELGIIVPETLQTAVQKRRAEFVAGRALARAALVQFGQHPNILGFGADRAPIWPVGTGGSITHSHGQCAAVVTNDDTLCGTDVEAIAQENALQAILQKCLSQKERDWLENDAPDPARFATALFSAKESIFKALYPIVQDFFGFEAAELVDSPTTDCLRFQLAKTLAPSLPKGFQIPVSLTMQENHLRTLVLIPRP